MGKSTALKYLALTWADGTEEQLTRFKFIFHISLKHVEDDSSIESIIISQHKGLKANNVRCEEIKDILEGQVSQVLLLVDGHDEYKTGRNTDIDKAIARDTLWNCWMILTSRETEQLRDIKENMDAEAEIKGFEGDNIRRYLTRSLGNEEDTNNFLEQAAESDLYVENKNTRYVYYAEILKIPLILSMLCTLFVFNIKTLAGTKGKVMQNIVDRCIDREAIRVRGQKAAGNAKLALFKLGKLAWKGLTEPGKRLLFEKVCFTYCFFYKIWSIISKTYM